MNKFILLILPWADVLLAPFVFLSAWLLKNVRRAGVHRLPFCKNVLIKIGVFPVRNHYYEPQFDYRKSKIPFAQDRDLPGMDWNITEQLDILARMSFAHELADIPQNKPDTLDFYINNGAFEAGDAEYWYQLIRSIKPRRIFEAGSGNSTLMAIKAIRRNQQQDSGYRCKHVCIEPYAAPWLEETGASVIRQKLEDIEPAFFAELEQNDILFIDSSHVIRPQGDVLFAYLELLPTLRTGVIVHIHDIFSPRNYLKQWLADEVRFWNEQYLLEAFMSHNNNWKITGALNYLHHHHYAELKAVATFLKPEHEPGSFYICKTG